MLLTDIINNFDKYKLEKIISIFEYPGAYYYQFKSISLDLYEIQYRKRGLYK